MVEVEILKTNPCVGRFVGRFVSVHLKQVCSELGIVWFSWGF